MHRSPKANIQTIVSPVRTQILNKRSQESCIVEYALQRLWEPYLEKQGPVLEKKLRPGTGKDPVTQMYVSGEASNLGLFLPSPTLFIPLTGLGLSTGDKLIKSTFTRKRRPRMGVRELERVPELSKLGELLAAFPLLGALDSPNCNHWTKDHNTSLTFPLGRRARNRASLLPLRSWAQVLPPMGLVKAEPGPSPASLNLDGP